MAKCIFRQLVVDMLSLFAFITITFFLTYVIPGDPFSPSEQRNVLERVLGQISKKCNLNDPLPAQYVRYLDDLLRGDIGVSFKKQDTTVSELIVNGFPVSAKVGALGVAVVLTVGISLGIVTAVKRGKLADGTSMMLATIGVSVPNFMFCVLTVYVFCGKWRVFLSHGLTSWRYYMLPMFCMAFSQVIYITRLIRSSVLETMRRDYIRTGHSKGMPEWEVISKYTLKNSVLPVVTHVGPLMAAPFTGVFIIEEPFSVPGLGRYFIPAITDRDYSVILGLTMFLGVTTISCNLIVDIMYTVVDPRVKITE